MTDTTDTEKNRPEFSVAAFYPDGHYFYVERFVYAECAVRVFKQVTEGVLARNGVLHRIIVTDGGDFTVAEWINGRGLTYPTKEQRSGGGYDV